MQNTLLSQDELDFLLTGAVKDRPDEAPSPDAAGQASQAQAKAQGQTQVQAQAGPAAESSPEAGAAPEAGATAGARALGFSPEARLRFALLLQEALRQDGDALCLVRPEQDGVCASGWKPCAELVCGSRACVEAGGKVSGTRSFRQAGVKIDARLAQALLARELGIAGACGLAGCVPTRLEQTVLRHALRAVPDCLAKTLASGGEGFQALGMAVPADGRADAEQAGFGFAVRLGSGAGRICVELA